jgi:hypothetical protein
LLVDFDAAVEEEDMAANRLDPALLCLGWRANQGKAISASALLIDLN